MHAPRYFMVSAFQTRPVPPLAAFSSLLSTLHFIVRVSQRCSRFHQHQHQNHQSAIAAHQLHTHKASTNVERDTPALTPKTVALRVDPHRAVIMAKRKGANEREVPTSALFKETHYGNGENAMSKRAKRHDKRSRIKASSSSAATKILNTTELLEHILHQLTDIRELVTCQRVSRVWYNLISTSIRLQQDLFFKSQPASSVPSWNPITSSIVKSLANKIYGQSHVWAPWPPENRLWAASCGGYFDLPKLKIYIRPEFPRRPECPRQPDGTTIIPPYDTLHFTQPKRMWPMPAELPIVVAERDKKTNALKAASTNEESWRKMFPTNPPSVIHVTEHPDHHIDHLLGVSYKVWTLGELVDKVIEFADRPGFADGLHSANRSLRYSNWRYAPIPDLPLNKVDVAR